MAQDRNIKSMAARMSMTIHAHETRPAHVVVVDYDELLARHGLVYDEGRDVSAEIVERFGSVETAHDDTVPRVAVTTTAAATVVVDADTIRAEHAAWAARIIR